MANSNPRTQMVGDCGSGYSERRETDRAVKAWFVEAYEELGQVAPAKAHQEADDAQWQLEFNDWHDDAKLFWEDWLAEKDSEARLDAMCESPRFKDMEFALRFKGC
jgi:hypothetical protein